MSWSDAPLSPSVPAQYLPMLLPKPAHLVALGSLLASSASAQILVEYDPTGPQGSGQPVPAVQVARAIQPSRCALSRKPRYKKAALVAA